MSRYQTVQPLFTYPDGIINSGWSINSNEVRSLIAMQWAVKDKALPSAFLTLNDARKATGMERRTHVVDGSFNVAVRSAPLRYRRKWIAIPPACCTTMRTAFPGVHDVTALRARRKRQRKKKKRSESRPRTIFIFLRRTGGRDVTIANIHLVGSIKFIHLAEINEINKLRGWNRSLVFGLSSWKIRHRQHVCVATSQ